MSNPSSKKKETTRDHPSNADGRVADAPSTHMSFDADNLKHVKGLFEMQAGVAEDRHALMEALGGRHLAGCDNKRSDSVPAQEGIEYILRTLMDLGLWDDGCDE
jgi:hypothetical protein